MPSAARPSMPHLTSEIVQFAGNRAGWSTVAAIVGAVAVGGWRRSGQGELFGVDLALGHAQCP